MKVGAAAIIRGFIAPGYEGVRTAFEYNFAAEGLREVGAGLTVFRHGECVVDLVGGYADRNTQRPWEPDTIANIWSSTKGVTAVAVARLVDRGLLRYEDRVADLWPEFAASGKELVTVDQLLSHQVGLNGFREPTTVEDFGDWALVTSRLAAQEPFWVPGKETSYHAMTYGFLAGEVARRVTGLEPRELIRQEIHDPIGADIQIGLSATDRDRVADLISFDASGAGNPPAPDLLAAPAMVNPIIRQDWSNRADWRAAQVPAGNGHASAQGLARMYAAIANGGRLDGVDFLTSSTINSMRRMRADRPDRFIGDRRWGAGFSINAGGAWGPDPEAFGHGGWGGSFGCASLKHGIAIGYVMNQMGGQVVGDPRGKRLCDAVFASLPSWST